MPLPNIPFVNRVALDWSTGGGGFTSTNVIHVSSESSDHVAITDALKAALESNPNMVAALTEEMQLVRLTLTPLDGVSASVVRTDIALSGQNGGGILPQVAQVTTFRTAVRGRQHRGRVFVGPAAEEAVEDGVFFGDTLTTVAPAWQAFHDDLAASVPIVVHGVASYTGETFDEVTAYETHATVGTIRRRAQRQYS